MKPKSKSDRLIVFAVLMALALCLLIVMFAFATQDTITARNATHTQNAIEATWDAE
jgi:hypothetical protein